MNVLNSQENSEHECVEFPEKNQNMNVLNSQQNSEHECVELPGKLRT